MELWEMSDGRIWQVEHLPLNRVRVGSLLDNGGVSRIGDFDNEAAVVLFAASYLRLTVVAKARD